MKTRFLPVLSLCAVIFGALSALTGAQENVALAAAPNAFSIRVYRMPADVLSAGFPSNERGELRAPELPDLNAGKEEIETFLKRSHDVMKEYLGQQYITLPKGSLACYDPVSGTLALRTPDIIHEMVAPFASALEHSLTKDVAWTLSILETKSALARAAMKEAAGRADHTGVFDRLLPRSKVVVTMRGDMKSGYQSKAAQGTRTNDLTGYSLDDKNRVTVLRTENTSGTELEMEPMINEEEQEIDLNFALRHRHMTGTPRREMLTTAAPEKIETHWMDRPLAEIKTSIRLKSGATKLLGTWAPDGDVLPDHSDLVRVAFFRGAIVTIQPLDDGRVAQLLNSYGEALEPTPKDGLKSKLNIPPGMRVRRFRVPPDFLLIGSEATGGDAPADPFASVAPNNSKPKRSKTAEEILREQGIPFPPGASASYYARTSELVVFNTQDALDLVDAFCWGCDDKPKLVSCSLHIVQADGNLIRKLDRSTFDLPDHTAAWKEVEDAVAKGTAKIVRSAWIETKSGQQCATQSVVEYRRADDPRATTAPRASESENPAAKNEPAATKGEISAPAGRLLEVGDNSQPSGLRCELEPVVGADGWTIELNVSVEYDYAPPVQRPPDEPQPDRTIRLALPSINFRRHEFKTTTTMRDGSTRMISVWKPDGTPELDGDVLQVAFLRVDLVRLNPPKK